MTNEIIRTKASAKNINIAFFSTVLIVWLITVSSYAFFTPDSEYDICVDKYNQEVEGVTRGNAIITESCIDKFGSSPYELRDCVASIAPMPVNSCINKGTGVVIQEDTKMNKITLRDKFGLSDCRFINDSHRLGKYNLEWMAYDIACDVGKSFDVRSPGDYSIVEIGYGTNLGDYIIIRSNVDYETRIVLGHTQTMLDVGAVLHSGSIIGQTNVSGASTGMHVHIELFQGYNNVSREFALGEKYKSINGTALLNHRGWDFGQKSDKYGIIKDLECKNGFHLESYWDYAQYSIGCGTKSFKGEIITEEEAYERFKKEVDRRYDIVVSHYPKLPIQKQIALTSLIYNNPECYNHFKNNGKIDMDIWKNRCNKAGGEVLKGLQIRREKEVELFNS